MGISSYLSASSLGSNAGLNFKNRKQRDLYTKQLIGSATKNDFVHRITLENYGESSVLTSSVDNNPPSWTQVEAGVNQSFALSEMSSSDHEVNVLNAYKTSPVALEETAVPASASEYYTKSNRLVHAIYKLSASEATVDSSRGVEYFDSVSGSFFQIGRATEVFVSGTKIGGVLHPTASYRAYELNIPDYGRIRDIKVWVELLTDNTQYGGWDLQNLFLGIRSPNVKFFSGYVVWNDQDLKNRTGAVPYGYLQATGTLKDHYQNTYVLWDGRASGGTTNPLTYNFRGDRNMRTIFHDGSNQRNPRHMEIAIENNNHYLRQIGSPSWKWQGEPTNPASYIGAKISWIADERILSASDPTGNSDAPPKGWLSGPNGTADVNEFPTTGSNYGPETMKPHRPLLDDIIERLESNISPKGYYEGFRPGLRGTEIHGTWQLIIGQNVDDDDDTFGYPGFFRQFRLEIIYEQNFDISKDRSKFNRDNVSIKKKGLRLLHIVSGSAGQKFTQSPDGGSTQLARIYEANNVNQYGATIGITSETGSIVDSAVFVRMTGSLEERLSGSDTSWFLRNEFGTPYIPISSGSGDHDNIITDNSIIKDILNPKPIISDATNLRSVLSTFDTTKTTRDIVSSNITGSL